MKKRHLPLRLPALVALCTTAMSCADSPAEAPDSDTTSGADVVAYDDIPEEPSTFESEPNDLPETANRFTIGTELTGHLQPTGDVDNFVTWLEGGTMLRLEAVFDRASKLTAEVVKVTPLALPLMSEPRPVIVTPMTLQFSLDHNTGTLFIPASGDYRISVTYAAPVRYALKTSNHAPSPTAAGSELPLRTPSKPFHQEVFRFTAATDMVLCSNAFVGRADMWSIGSAWAYHPSDPSVTMTVGGVWFWMFRWLFGVPLRKGQEVWLVSGMLGYPWERRMGDAPVTEFVTLETELQSGPAERFFPSYLGTDETVEGDFVPVVDATSRQAVRDSDYFLLADARATTVTLTLETEPPGVGSLSLWWYYPHDHHGPMILPFEALVLTSNEGLQLELPRDVMPRILLVGLTDTREVDAFTPPVVYRITTSSAPIESALLAADTDHLLSFEPGGARVFRTEIAPGTCLFADHFDATSTPPHVSEGFIHTRDAACDTSAREAIFTCVAESDPTRTVHFEVGLGTESPASELLLRIRSASYIGTPESLVTAADENDTPEGATRLVPPVKVTGLDSPSGSTDHFTVALRRNEVLVAVLEKEDVSEPDCVVTTVNIAPGGFPGWWDVPTPHCRRAPSVSPAAPPWEINEAFPNITAYRAPRDFVVGVGVQRWYNTDCSEPGNHTLKLAVLPAPDPNGR